MCGNDRGTCGAKGCMCGMMPNEIDPNTCHGCDGFGWVPVGDWARLCPVCGGSGEHRRVYRVQEYPNSTTTTTYDPTKNTTWSHDGPTY